MHVLTDTAFSRFPLLIYPLDRFFLSALFLRAVRGGPGARGPRCWAMLGHLVENGPILQPPKIALKLRGRNRSKPIGEPRFGGVILATCLGRSRV